MDIVGFYKRKQTNENMEAGMKEMDEKLGKTLSQKIIVLMKRSQSKLEKKEQQKHTNGKWTNILEPLTKMRIVKK